MTADRSPPPADARRLEPKRKEAIARQWPDPNNPPDDLMVYVFTCGWDYALAAAEADAGKLREERDAQGEMAVGYRSSWLAEENKRFAAEASASRLRERVAGLLMFCNADGSPCDGFRFREEALALRAALRAELDEGTATPAKPATGYACPRTSSPPTRPGSKPPRARRTTRSDSTVNTRTPSTRRATIRRPPGTSTARSRARPSRSGSGPLPRPPVRT